MVAEAKARRQDLTDPNDLLRLFTNKVLEIALNEEIAERLGHEKTPAEADRELTNVRNGSRGSVPAYISFFKGVYPAAPGSSSASGKCAVFLAVSARFSRYVIDALRPIEQDDDVIDERYNVGPVGGFGVVPQTLGRSQHVLIPVVGRSCHLTLHGAKANPLTPQARHVKFVDDSRLRRSPVDHDRPRPRQVVSVSGLG